MNAFWTLIDDWLIHSAAGASVLLLVACGLMAGTRQPVRRQRLGELGVLAALILTALCLAPRWLVLPWPALTPVAAANERVDAAARPTGGDSDKNVQPTEEDAELAAFLFGFVVPTPEATPIEHRDAGAVDPRTAAALPSANVVEIARHAVLATFAAGVSFFFLRWLLGMIGLARLLRRAHPAPPSFLHTIEDAVDMDAVRVLVSPRVRAPISCGLLRPTIVLPAAFCQSCDESKLRWILTHELTHLRRGDAWSSLLFAFGQIAFFYLPWFWWVRRQVRLCQEYVADAAAIGAVEGCVPADYAELLLSLTKVAVVPLGATGVSGHRSDLYRRLSMLLQNPMRVEQRCPQRWLLFAGVLFLCAAVVLSGLGVASVAAAPETKVALQSAPPAAPAPAAQNPALPQKPATPAAPQQSVPPKEPVQPQKQAEPENKQNEPNPHEQIQKALRDLATPGADVEAARAQIEQAMKRLQETRRFPGQFNPGEWEVDISRSFGAPGFPGQGGFEIRRGPFDRGRLGVSVDRPSDILADQLDLPKGEGLVVTDVVPKSAAEQAGIKVNDILLELNKKPVKSDPSEFARGIMDMKGDVTVELGVLRKGKRLLMKDVKLPEPKRAEAPRPPFPPDFAFPFRGGPGTAMTTVMRDKDSFTANHREGKLSIRVTGKIDGAKTMVDRVLIQDGPQQNTYDTLEACPAEHRERVNRLLDASRGTAPQPPQAEKK